MISGKTFRLNLTYTVPPSVVIISPVSYTHLDVYKRQVKKFFLEAKTAPGANDTLTDDAALKIMQKLVKRGKYSAAIYEGQGRADLAEAELAQVAVLEAYLPKQMSNEELEAALQEIIAEVGAAGPQDMGKVMGVATRCV